MFLYFCSAIHQGLSLGIDQFYCIGLSDQESEGNFVWVNGDRASDEDLRPGAIVHNGPSRDCCFSRFDRMYQDVQVFSCYVIDAGICEKPV